MQPRPGVVRYLALADALRRRILAGELPPGTRVPSEATLAQQHGITRETARHALAILRGEGLLDVRQGIGTYVRSAEAREEFSLQRGSRITWRSPTAAERDEFELADGVAVAVVVHGARTRVFPGDRWSFIVK